MDNNSHPSRPSRLSRQHLRLHTDNSRIDSRINSRFSFLWLLQAQARMVNSRNIHKQLSVNSPSFRKLCTASNHILLTSPSSHKRFMASSPNPCSHLTDSKHLREHYMVNSKVCRRRLFRLVLHLTVSIRPASRQLQRQIIRCSRTRPPESAFHIPVVVSSLGQLRLLLLLPLPPKARSTLPTPSPMPRLPLQRRPRTRVTRHRMLYIHLARPFIPKCFKRRITSQSILPRPYLALQPWLRLLLRAPLLDFQ
jgi:hypothetical protein